MAHPPQSDTPIQWPSSGGCRWRCERGLAGTRGGPAGSVMEARASLAAAGRCRSQMCTCCNTRAPQSAGSLPRVWRCPVSACPGGLSSGVDQTACSQRFGVSNIVENLCRRFFIHEAARSLIIKQFNSCYIKGLIIPIQDNDLHMCWNAIKKLLDDLNTTGFIFLIVHAITILIR